MKGGEQGDPGGQDFKGAWGLLSVMAISIILIVVLVSWVCIAPTSVSQHLPNHII